jgi:SP family myo-inositol transporter-like MFS transporter 13
MADRDHMAYEQGLEEKAQKFQHLETRGDGRHDSLGAQGVTRTSFDRRHSVAAGAAERGSRRGSIRQSFEKSNLATVFPDSTHLEVSDDEMGKNTIDDLGTSWFVWLVAATASIAGSLFGYDTGIISAVLVYLKDDLNNRPVSSNEKELITSLCSGGAFVGAIIAGLTADQVRPSSPGSFSIPTLC